jgi:aminoglycoside 2'-N-acetyltransferase I
MHSVRLVRTADLTPVELKVVRTLCDAAWAGEHEEFAEDDWQHALGGMHVLVEDGEELLAHGSVVPRTLRAGGIDVATGYVEALATRPAHQRRGYGTAVMRAVTAYVDQTFALGALCTGVPAFYERLGWRLWLGPTSVIVDGAARPTPDEDGTVLVRLTPSSPALDLSQPISCDWRRGDVW